MDNFNQQPQLSSKPPQSLMSKIDPIKPLQQFKLRKAGHIVAGLSCSTSMKPRPPGTSTAMSMSSANSTISTVKGHKDLNFLPAVADAASQEKLFRNVSNALQPLKPKILPNDLLEYEYSQYLDEELLASLLEEDEETTKNILVDEEVVSEIQSYFQERETGITLAKNSILHSKLNDIEALDGMLSSLTAISNLLTPDLNHNLSSITVKLSDSLDLLPISNCTFNNGDKQRTWKELTRVARKLNANLCSEEKPFHFINLLENGSKEARQQIENLELSVKQKLALQQSLTFLTSLRLSQHLLKKNAFQMSDGASFITEADEELNNDGDVCSSNNSNLGLDDISEILHPDDTF